MLASIYINRSAPVGIFSSALSATPSPSSSFPLDPDPSRSVKGFFVSAILALSSPRTFSA